MIISTRVFLIPVKVSIKNILSYCYKGIRNHVALFQIVKIVPFLLEFPQLLTLLLSCKLLLFVMYCNYGDIFPTKI